MGGDGDGDGDGTLLMLLMLDPWRAGYLGCSSVQWRDLPSKTPQRESESLPQLGISWTVEAPNARVATDFASPASRYI
jgi:hypothetical protein